MTSRRKGVWGGVLKLVPCLQNLLLLNKREAIVPSYSLKWLYGTIREFHRKHPWWRHVSQETSEVEASFGKAPVINISNKLIFLINTTEKDNMLRSYSN